MSHAKDFGLPSQPASVDDKTNTARDIMGLGKKKGPSFHRISISTAENGVTVEHTKPEKPSTKGKNGETISSSYDPSRTTTHVFGHGHDIMKHIHAISGHCTGD